MIEQITAPDRAATLREAAQKVGVALLALETYDACHAGQRPTDAQASDRRLLVDVAAQLLWQYIVQRELSGALDHREVQREYQVPREVWVRMGATPRAA
jgi:hypothetical protein